MGMTGTWPKLPKRVLNNICIIKIPSHIARNPSSVRPRLPADLDYRLSAHGLSTNILWTFTRLYGKIYKRDTELRLFSKNGSEVLDSFEDTR